MMIWAKLTQGNSRGTCCWITHNLLFYLLKSETLNVNSINLAMINIIDLDKSIKHIPVITYHKYVDNSIEKEKSNL